MTHHPPNRFLTAALQAAERGWLVFPLRVGDKPPALHGETSCTGSGPCAAGHRKWEQQATTDPGRLRAAWAVRPFNIGIATGPAGLVVVDLDMPKPKDPKGTPCGVTTFAVLCERAGQAVPATYRVRTASGGQHLYFTTPDGVRLHNTRDHLGKKIDTRAWGGYVVAAGSSTRAGAYTVLDDLPVAPLPPWLQEALTPAPPARHAPTVRVARDASSYAAVGLRNEEAAVRAAVVGERNDKLTRAARAMGRFVASGDLDRAEVEQALNCAGLAAGLSERECRATITQALNWSIARNPGRPA
ncbi:DNA primase [Streptomyces sp. So13.3]|uniref:bifunctional DNA primase/polymerase n=1 Tax=Streptomyces sp. So13.3 TaxID=2136173 RepID=UPI0011071E61|nr:bifunctional DNA primase/polymerase [Streptomyces sp. So13.3]QNA74160.1 DNA primase [Streptomyces sp. So13.3]